MQIRYIQIWILSVIGLIFLNGTPLLANETAILQYSELTRIGNKPGGYFDGGTFIDQRGQKWLVKDFTREENAADAQRFIVNNIVASRVLEKVFPSQYPKTALIHNDNKKVAVQWVEGFLSHEMDAEKICKYNRASNAQLIITRTFINWENNSEGNVGCIVRDGFHFPARVDYDDSFWFEWEASIEERCFSQLDRYDRDELLILTHLILKITLDEYEQTVDSALSDVSKHLELDARDIEKHKRRIMHVIHDGYARILWFYAYLTDDKSLIDCDHECHKYWLQAPTY